jgi:Fe-S-cluster containining protein
MEFTIDFATVRKITAREYAQARTEITELGVMTAYQRSRARHDERLAAAPDAPTLACKAGCSWCCHFSVDVRPAEVFAILEFVAQNLSPQEQERVRKEIEANSAVLKDLSDLERVKRNLKCPFLNDGRCTIYVARPQTCRNYHATNAAGCQKSFEEPENLDIDPDFAPLVYQAGGAHVDAFSKAMRDAGYDIAAYELNTALMTAMADPETTRQRFDNKQSPFRALHGSDVQLEFTELDE